MRQNRQRHSWTQIANRWLLPCLLPAALVAIWQMIVGWGWLSSRLLPAAAQVAGTASRLLFSGELFHHIASSSARAGVGLLIGGGAGFVLGVVNGTFRAADRVLDSTVQMLRTIPHLALLPLIILWFGIDETAKVVLVALGVFFPIYIHTVHGIRSTDPQLLEMGRVYGLSGPELFRQVVFAGALPSILVGVRAALGVMWLTLIVAETLATTSGIGYLAMNAREFMQTDVVVLAILLYALLGKLSDAVTKALERRLLRWHPVLGSV